MMEPDAVLERLKALAAGVRNAVLHQVAIQGKGDAERGLEGVDEAAEEELRRFCEDWALETPILLIHESRKDGPLAIPAGLENERYEGVVTVDPVDGSVSFVRGIEPAWVLAAWADGHSREPRLRDVDVAVQAEIPVSASGSGRVFTAIRGRGAGLEVWDLARQALVAKEILISPRAGSMRGGFVMFSKYLMPGSAEVAAMEERLFRSLYGDGDPQAVFDHQCISSACQFARVMTGQYRLVVDVRPVLKECMREVVDSMVCAHPYDVCTSLIAAELGVIVTDLEGRPLDCPLDAVSDVGYIVYANESIRQEAEERLLTAIRGLRKHRRCEAGRNLRP